MQYVTIRALVSFSCIVLIIIHKWIPSFELDAITLSLIITGGLPWLQPIFKTIKLPGGFEVTLQELKQEVKAAAGAARSAEMKAELAVSGIVPQAEPLNNTQNDVHTAQDEPLSRQYERIRNTRESGSARTQAMTAIVRKMIESASSISDDNLKSLLESKRSGDRLSAYANIYARPKPSVLEDLVISVTAREDKPFGQYWGLQAIARNLPFSAQHPPNHQTLQALISYSSRVPAGSDRKYEIERILKQLGLRNELIPDR